MEGYQLCHLMWTPSRTKSRLTAHGTTTTSREKSFANYVQFYSWWCSVENRGVICATEIECLLGPLQVEGTCAAESRNNKSCLAHMVFLVLPLLPGWEQGEVWTGKVRNLTALSFLRERFWFGSHIIFFPTWDAFVLDGDLAQKKQMQLSYCLFGDASLNEIKDGYRVKVFDLGQTIP